MSTIIITIFRVFALFMFVSVAAWISTDKGYAAWAALSTGRFIIAILCVFSLGAIAVHQFNFKDK